jgi:hypothetical protein
MAPAVCRAGILAALRSVKLAGAAVGIVITASHNPIGDNGVKIADPDGGMMAQHWEPFADALANAPDPDALLQVMDQAVRPRLFLSFVPLVSIRIQRQLHRLIHTNKYWYLLGVNKTKIRESCKPPFVLPHRWCFSLPRTRAFHWEGKTQRKCCLAEIPDLQELTSSTLHCRCAMSIRSFKIDSNRIAPSKLLFKF